jgi:hypothetical protein
MRVLTKTCLCCLTLINVVNAQADQTFLWSGDDQHFSGWFSISDADFARRSFQTLKAARFEYNDPQKPAVSVILDDPAGFHMGNTHGTITTDGTRLKQDSWVAVWQPETGIEVGMYGHFDSAGQELFTYANYLDHFFVESKGTWALQVPEPATNLLFLTGLVILFCGRTYRRFLWNRCP